MPATFNHHTHHVEVRYSGARALPLGKVPREVLVRHPLALGETGPGKSASVVCACSALHAVRGAPYAADLPPSLALENAHVR